MNIVILLIALLLGYLGINFTLFEILKRRKCTEIVTGKVSDIYEKEKNKKGHLKIYYYPIFEYEVNGKIYTQKSEIGSTKPKFNLNEEVEIHYNSEVPDNYYIYGFNDIIQIGFILLAFSLLLIFTGMNS